MKVDLCVIKRNESKMITSAPCKGAKSASVHVWFFEADIDIKDKKVTIRINFNNRKSTRSLVLWELIEIYQLSRLLRIRF